MKYRVWHQTAYTYDAPVTDSYGSCHLLPRERPWQRVVEKRVDVTPAPGDVTDDVDYFGNISTYFQVTEPHRELVIEASSEVEVTDPEISQAALDRSWHDVRPLESDCAFADAWKASEFALASPLVAHEDVAKQYAATSLTPDRAVGPAVTELMHRIFADFEYDKTATSVTSTIEDVMAKRAGVCQDFAHLALACLRSHGLAVRYISGYLATQPPPGKERVFGADASHAWVEVWLGDDEWLALDPTNDQVAGERYVSVGYGRDYGDVPPVKGVIFTEAKRSTLRVSVDVAPLVADDAANDAVRGIVRS